MNHGTLTRAKLIDYFIEGCKPRSQWLVGMELEKMGRDSATGRPLLYDGEGPSVRKALEHYHALRGGDPIYEGDLLVGIDGTWGTISLEPGGQVEWSSPACPSLGVLARELEAHLVALRETGTALGIVWLDLALDPVEPVEAMPWMPKARYKIMRRYLGARGRLAHRMMTQTASVHCAFDYESPEDWALKFRAGALLAPVVVALFTNSSRVDGKESGYRSFRQRIWQETDPDRCGLPEIVFAPDFGIESWVSWACRVPTIFHQKARGLVPSGGVPFADLLRRAGCSPLRMEDWELHLSTIFTEVRSYTYIEVRSADLPPEDRLLAVPVLWTGILYHGDSLRGAIELGSGHDTYAGWNDAMESAARFGLEGTAGGRPLRELAKQALALSIEGLGHGAACSGGPPDPAAPLLHLAHALRLDLPGQPS